MIDGFYEETVKFHQPQLTNIYDSSIGAGTSIGAFTEIGGANIGEGCKIQAHVFIPPGTSIGNYVFIGPGVRFCNVTYPDPFKPAEDFEGVTVRFGAVIGAGAIILPGVHIGANAVIGAGAVVTDDVMDGRIVAGNPAKDIGESYLIWED